MVEFALVGPILFLLMFAIFQVGVLYLQYQQVGFAASEAARCAAVARTAPIERPACAPLASSPTNAAVTRAVAKAPSLQLTASDISVASDSGWEMPGHVTVRVTYASRLPVIGRSLTLRASSTAKLER